jgi:hypothetical protein
MKHNKVLLGAALWITVQGVLQAQVPQIMNYQGRVTVVGSGDFTGAGQLKFALVDGGHNTNGQAAATAIVDHGFIVAVNLVSGGSGYTTPPTVTVTDSTGSGASISANLSGGSVTGFTINDAGHNYSASPTITIAPPPPNIVYVTYWSNDGTSTAGSEPTAAVSLPVNSGSYAVLLGDTNLAHMTSIPPSVFANSDVRLRVWFNDSSHGSQLLVPDQRIAAVGYAMMANIPDGAITSAKIADGAVGSAQLAANAVSAGKIANGAVGSAQLSANAVSSANIAPGQVVKSLNGLSDLVTLSAGPNISMSSAGNAIRISAGAATGGTAIPSVPYTITQPGLYYLTNNLNITSGDAVTINANGVTLDLNGFTISSTDPNASGAGILLGAVSDIAILNGHIRGGVTYSGGVFGGAGFGNGVSGAVGLNVRVVGLSVSGCRNYGIDLAVFASTVIESCTVRTVGNDGMLAASISLSTAIECGGSGVAGFTVSDCVGNSVASGSGIAATTARNCYGTSASGAGVSAKAAADCYGYSVSSFGVRAGAANNCYGYADTGDGLWADSASNCRGDTTGGYAALYAVYNASNCAGYNSNDSDSAVGLAAGRIATGCYGYCSKGTAVKVYQLELSGVAIGCFGETSWGTGTGLDVFLANSCDYEGGDTHISVKYNMP